MIVMLLLEKIAALCLILCMGVFLVKIGIMDGKDSKVISALSVHLMKQYKSPSRAGETGRRQGR